MNRLSFLVLAGLMTTQAVLAQDDNPQLPATTTIGAATYLSGGIGLDESAAMKRAAKKYPLELVFIRKGTARNEYSSDAQVKITDKHGKTVIEAVSDGPYFLADLPDGTYRVEASKDGASKVQQMVVKKAVHKRLIFSWAD